MMTTRRSFLRNLAIAVGCVALQLRPQREVVTIDFPGEWDPSSNFDPAIGPDQAGWYCWEKVNAWRPVDPSQPTFVAIVFHRTDETPEVR